jgi:hypothetical protein
MIPQICCEHTNKSSRKKLKNALNRSNLMKSRFKSGKIRGKKKEKRVNFSKNNPERIKKESLK